ncbi:MAG: HD domain-containing protein [Fimbriimonadaceae bacterium]|jgi:guanosine-3',5'-bis(diphosphate) 3'-pyrophosphohydrolase|nr:HD domain-containing protein [Fimbriimonadaceae bacterium]
MATGLDLSHALQFAAEKHAGQWRDGDHPLPYIVHPVEVVTFLRRVGDVTSPVILCAAALHDVLEDTNCQPEEIVEAFGSDVLRLVREVTREEPTEEQKEGLTSQEVWEIRNEMLRNEIQRMSRDARMIKLADRINNLDEAIATRSDKSLQRYIRQSEMILAAIPESTHPALWRELKKQITRAKKRK